MLRFCTNCAESGDYCTCIVGLCKTSQSRVLTPARSFVRCCFGSVGSMGLLSGRLGLKKLAFLQERDDRFSATLNSGKPIPAITASLSSLISFLQLSHFLTSIGRELVMIIYGL